MLRLSNSSLPQLPAVVDSPTYDRSLKRSGIVHVGVGHFHRSHQAMYLDRLIRLGRAEHWGICGVTVLDSDTAHRDTLRAQDYLYTLTLKEADGTKVDTVIGSLHGYLSAVNEPRRVVEQLADADTRIISLTITEGGYDVSDSTGQFLASTPAVRADLASRAPSQTIFGLFFQAATLRREKGIGGLTILSCDNIQSNGMVARAAFLGFSNLRDPRVADWIGQECTFPNSMVDRVTPRTVQADIDHITQVHGYHDTSPVTCEPFSQWVMEDNFAAGRPTFEEVGVDIVHDVEPYELMKLRLANGTHQALCYWGYLLGYTFVAEAIRDTDIRRLVMRYIDEEVIPTLEPILGVDLNQYGHSVVERFSNPRIHDTLTRICADTSDRIPKFLLPVVRERLATGARVPMCAAVVAAWTRYAEGTDERGKPIAVVDPRRDVLMASARARREDPTAFIENRSVFGDIADSVHFVTDYTTALRTIDARGVRAALQELIRC